MTEITIKIQGITSTVTDKHDGLDIYEVIQLVRQCLTGVGYDANTVEEAMGEPI